MCDSNLEIIDNNAFDMYSYKNTLLREIICPMSLKTIGTNAFRNITNLSLFSIPYTFEYIDKTCLAGSAIITKDDITTTYNKLHIRIKREDVINPTNNTISESLITNLLTKDENKEKFFNLRSINTFNPSNTDLRFLICDENDAPLTIKNDLGTETRLTLDIPAVKTNSLRITKLPN
jgi:hypothetical protein